MTQEALKLALEKIATVNAMDYEYQAWAREALAQTERPAPCARHCEANAFKIVIKNLKAQLAQTQEPVSNDPLPRACNLAGVDYQTFLKIKAYMPVAPPQRTEQEPVAWMDADGNVSDNNDHNCFPIPLYTTPPQRKPLTDEQIADLWSAQIFHITDLKLAKDFVRDIEAAHGIKENT